MKAPSEFPPAPHDPRDRAAGALAMAAFPAVGLLYAMGLIGVRPFVLASAGALSLFAGALVTATRTPLVHSKYPKEWMN